MKALVMHYFMFEMNERDVEEMAAEVKPGNLEISYRHAIKISKRVSTRYDQASVSWVYKVCLDYRVQELQDSMESGVVKFNKFERGKYERKFLLDQEYLKLQFKHWMQKNINKLCVDSAQASLNNTMKRKVGPQVLESQNITSRLTSFRASIRSSKARTRTDSDATRPWRNRWRM